MKLMIVDNDRAFLRSLEIILFEEGYEIICCDNPVIAYHRLMAGEKTDILLTDYRMPEINGDLLIKASHRKRPDIRACVLISGHIDGMSPAELQETEVDFVLKKPFDLKELLQLLRNLKDKTVEHG